VARRLFEQVRDSAAAGSAGTESEPDPHHRDAVRRLGELEQRDRARADFQALPRLRNEALFLLFADAFTGTQAGNPEKAVARARAALAPYGLPEGQRLGEAALAGLSDAEQHELRGRVYDLCLLLAEALARLPGAEPLRRQHAAEALAVLDRAAPLAPGGRVSPLQRARYLARRGDDAAAQREKDRADAGGGTAMEAFLDGCALAFELGDADAALARFNAAVQLRPDLFWAHLFRGVVYQRQQMAAEARASFTIAQALRRDFPWTYLLHGSLCSQVGDFVTAEEDLRQAGRLLRTDDHLGQYVLHANRGYLALQQRDPVGAIAECNQALGFKADEYSAHVNLARAYAQCEDLARAVQEMDTALRLKPDLVQLYRTRADYQVRREQWRPALHDLDEALRRAEALARRDVRQAPRLAVGMADDHRGRAEILYRLRLYPQAVLACVAALELNGSNAAAQRLHGESLLEMGFWEDALEALDGVPLAQRDVDFYHRRAHARARVQDFAGAIADYSQALERRVDAETLVERGRAYLQSDAPRPALHDFAQALRHDPKRRDAHFGRCQAHLRLGQDLRAAQAAEEALRQLGHSSEVLLQAAQIFCQISGNESPQRRIYYEDRAVSCLQDATMQLPPAEQAALWKLRILRDTSLQRLQGKPAFERLRREFAAPMR
jgi:tetratricopeptide (TPR) repeat protein